MRALLEAGTTVCEPGAPLPCGGTSRDLRRDVAGVGPAGGGARHGRGRRGVVAVGRGHRRRADATSSSSSCRARRAAKGAHVNVRPLPAPPRGRTQPPTDEIATPSTAASISGGSCRGSRGRDYEPGGWAERSTAVGPSSFNVPAKYRRADAVFVCCLLENQSPIEREMRLGLRGDLERFRRGTLRRELEVLDPSG